MGADRLYIYPPGNWMERTPELAREVLRDSQAIDGDAFLLEAAAGSGRLERIQNKLRSANILCDTKPIPGARWHLWEEFMLGKRKPEHFRFPPFLFGPLWYLARGMLLKASLLAAVFLGLRALLSRFEGAGVDWPVWIALTLHWGPLKFLLHWGVLEHLFVAMCAGTFGEYDLFLYRVQGERLWKRLPYERFQILAWSFITLCLACWLWVSVRLDPADTAPVLRASVEGTLKTSIFGKPPPSPKGYWDDFDAAFTAGRYAEAETIARARAEKGDAEAEFRLGRVLFATAARDLGSGKKAEAAARFDEGKAHMLIAARKGHDRAWDFLVQFQQIKEATRGPK